MATKQTDLTGLRHALVYAPLHFYTEVQDDGTEVLRHIRVQKHNYQVPAEGITIDSLPDNIIGSEHIKDGTVQEQDLSQQLKSGLVAASEKGASGGVASLGQDGKVPASQLPEATVATEADVRAIVNNYNDN